MYSNTKTVCSKRRSAAGDRLALENPPHGGSLILADPVVVHDGIEPAAFRGGGCLKGVPAFDVLLGERSCSEGFVQWLKFRPYGPVGLALGLEPTGDGIFAHLLEIDLRSVGPRADGSRLGRWRGVLAAMKCGEYQSQAPSDR